MDNLMNNYLHPFLRGLAAPSPTGAGGPQGLGEAYSFTPPITGGPELHGLLGLLSMMGKLNEVQPAFKDLPKMGTNFTKIGDEFFDLAKGPLKEMPYSAEPGHENTLLEFLKTLRGGGE